MTYFSEFEDEQVSKPSRRRRVIGWTFFGLFAAAVLAASYLPAPYVIERPGPAFNVLGQQDGNRIITVSGADSYEASGALDLLTVSIVGNPGNTPTWWELGAAWLDPAQNILPLEQIFPANQTASQSDAQNAALMKSSQQAAVAAALTNLGYQLKAKVSVVGFGANSPAEGKLQNDDQVLRIDSQTITSVADMRKALDAKNGNPVKVVVLRAGAEKSYTITPVKLAGAWRLAVQVVEDWKFPFQVNLQLQNVGGPSGGMIFALGIIDTLTPGSLTGGQIIAGTGTITSDGQVGPIGGIREKLYSAVRAGASWFLAPAANCNEVVGHVPTGLTVIKVENLGQAVKAVKQVASTKSASGLPTCTAN